MDPRTPPSEDSLPGDLPTVCSPDQDSCPGAQKKGGTVLNLGGSFVRTIQHFWPALSSWLGDLPDSRFQPFVTYDKKFLLWWGLGLFAFKLGSRRQLDFDLRDMDSHVLDNFNRLAQTDQNSLPVHQTLAHLLGHVGSRPIARLRTLLVRRILRMRVLDDDRVQDHYVVGVDGTGMYSFKTRHCPYCLTQKHGGVTSYFHPVLEAKILTRAGLALSVGSEFIENLVPRGLAQDPNYPEVKQDCELKAFARMAPQIRRDFPQLSMAITSDALYACGTAIQLCKDHGMGYIFTFKPGSLPAVWEEFQALLRECPENTRSVTLPSGTVQIYRWVNQISYQDSAGRHHTFDAFLCQETTPDGLSTLFAWITHFHVTRENVVLLSEKGGRVRTVIENQGFNVQKNSGLNLEHVYGISDTNRKAFYYLLQIAHILLQFFERGSLLKQIAAQQGKTVLQLFGSLKNIARRLLECFRYFLIPQDAYDATLAARIQIRLNSS